MSDVPTLSTGQPSTLKVWHALSASVFGADSKATAFLADKMAEQGEDEPGPRRRRSDAPSADAAGGALVSAVAVGCVLLAARRKGRTL